MICQIKTNLNKKENLNFVSKANVKNDRNFKFHKISKFALLISFQIVYNLTQMLSMEYPFMCSCCSINWFEREVTRTFFHALRALLVECFERLKSGFSRFSILTYIIKNAWRMIFFLLCRTILRIGIYSVMQPLT